MACTPDTVTPKGVLINLNSGSDYTNCTVYTGLTDSTVTGTTNCINVTGTTCSLTGLSATLMEVFVKIDCEGCCSNTFRVNLDECCGYEEVLTPTPTPTYSQTITPTYSQTPTPTFTPSACECNTYRITFNGPCGEFINWTDCDTNTLMSEQGDYFGLSDVSFTTGTVLDLCSCSLPTTDCTLVTISLVTTGCTIEGGFFITTPTPTPTATPCNCYYYTVTISQVDIDASDDGYVYVSYNDCSNEPIVIPYSAAGEYVNDICVLNTSTPMQYYVFDGLNNLTTDTPVNSLECCVSVTPTPTPTLTLTPTVTDVTVYNSAFIYEFQRVSGGTTYDISMVASSSTNAQSAYCDISDRENGAQINGGTLIHYSPLAVGVQVIWQSIFAPYANEHGYVSTSLFNIGQPSGTTYYFKTDSGGYITEFVEMDYCWISHNAFWSFTFDCTSSCDLTGSVANIVLYTEGPNATWTEGMFVYTDPARTTFFSSGRYVKYQGKVWEHDNISGLIEVCVVGQPC
jgi:hypothetical protein